LRITLVQRQANPEMRIVIEIGSGLDNPINKAGLDQGNERGDAQARGGERASDRKAHSNVGLEHLAREKMARLTQTRGVISEKGFVNEVREGGFRSDGRGIYSFPMEELASLLCHQRAIRQFQILFIPFQQSQSISARTPRVSLRSTLGYTLLPASQVR